MYLPCRPPSSTFHWSPMRLSQQDPMRNATQNSSVVLQHQNLILHLHVYGTRPRTTAHFDQQLRTTKSTTSYIMNYYGHPILFCRAHFTRGIIVCLSHTHPESGGIHLFVCCDVNKLTLLLLRSQRQLQFDCSPLKDCDEKYQASEVTPI